ncbi:MAG: hypothetical protein M3Y23_00230 [Actinomycetota bacterium]|nr:hypothetical protein [Actinomycetota bacterium]
MRRPISTRLHGFLDYSTGALLLAAPSFLGLERKGRAALALQGAGAGHIAYSLITDYEVSLRKSLPMPAHLAIDAAGAIGLAASPWLLGTAGKSKKSWLPHLLLGAYELTAVALSQTESPSHEAERTAPEPEEKPVSKTPDKPAGTELHPPNTNFARQGPGGGPGKPAGALKANRPATGQPRPEAGPGERGVTNPKR